MWHVAPETFADVASNTPVELQANVISQNYKFKAFLVGQREGDYLVLELNRHFAWHKTIPLLQDSSSVIVRCVLPCGSVVAGVASFLSTTTYPRKLLFLNYPSTVETRHLRQRPRIPVELEAKLRFDDDQELSGIVSDLSQGGIGFNLPGKPPESPQWEREQLMEKPVELDVYDEQEFLVTLIGRIRSCRHRFPNGRPEHLALGIKIEGASGQYPHCLHDLILHSQHVKALVAVDS